LAGYWALIFFPQDCGARIIVYLRVPATFSQKLNYGMKKIASIDVGDIGLTGRDWCQSQTDPYKKGGEPNELHCQ
jgi:hypothetical protein